MQKNLKKQKYPTIAITVLFLSLVLILTQGCLFPGGSSLFSRDSASYFVVEISSLDWIELHYLPRPDDPVFLYPCRLGLFGAGEIEFATGRSKRVTSSFNMEVDSPYWDDLHTDRMHIGQDQMQELFQDFVDAGLFPRRGTGPPPERSAPLVKVNSRIGRKRTLRITDDRKIVRIVEGILANFVQ